MARRKRTGHEIALERELEVLRARVDALQAERLDLSTLGALLWKVVEPNVLEAIRDEISNTALRVEL